MTLRPANSRGQPARNRNGRAALIADLTWADLYAHQIRRDLKQLTQAIRKASGTPELLDSAEKLRGQLEGAHRTVAELMSKFS